MRNTCVPSNEQTIIMNKGKKGTMYIFKKRFQKMLESFPYDFLVSSLVFLMPICNFKHKKLFILNIKSESKIDVCVLYENSMKCIEFSHKTHKLEPINAPSSRVLCENSMHYIEFLYKTHKFEPILLEILVTNRKVL